MLLLLCGMCWISVLQQAGGMDDLFEGTVDVLTQLAVL